MNISFSQIVSLLFLRSLPNPAFYSAESSKAEGVHVGCVTSDHYKTWRVK